MARERTGCEIFCGKLEEAPFAGGGFDVITMWDLLEHLPDPLLGLERARRLLKPSGLLLVNTPNERSLLRRVAHFLYRGSGGWITAPVNRLYHGYHLYYFGAQTLTVLFRRAGFELLEMSTKQHPRVPGTDLAGHQGGDEGPLPRGAPPPRRVRADRVGQEPGAGPMFYRTDKFEFVKTLKAEWAGLREEFLRNFDERDARLFI